MPSGGADPVAHRERHRAAFIGKPAEGWLYRLKRRLDIGQVPAGHPVFKALQEYASYLFNIGLTGSIRRSKPALGERGLRLIGKEYPAAEPARPVCFHEIIMMAEMGTVQNGGIFSNMRDKYARSARAAPLTSGWPPTRN